MVDSDAIILKNVTMNPKNLNEDKRDYLNLRKYYESNSIRCKQ